MRLTRGKSFALFSAMVIAVLAVCIFVPCGLTINDVDKVVLGMKKAEVYEILGAPIGISPRCEIWMASNGLIFVTFANSETDPIVDTKSVEEFPRWKMWWAKLNQRINW